MAYKILDYRGDPYRLANTYDYDALNGANRRRVRSIKLKSEDEHLKQQPRQRLITNTRDLMRNFSLAGWAVRRHLDYVTTFEFQSRTGDKGLDDEIESFVRWYSRPVNCDVTGRFSLSKLARMAEERKVVDGDCFFLKLSDGRIQPIEGDRVQDPAPIPDSLQGKGDIVQGVQLDSDGAAKGYIVCNRTDSGFEYGRFLRAPFVLHYANIARFDQVRGVSILASAINALRDCYEAFDYALAKMKLSQLLGLAFYRNDFNEYEDSDQSQEVNFSNSLATINLGTDERAEILESHSPSSEFQSFAQKSISLVLKALDIPYSDFDEAYTNYSGIRQAALQYERSADIKREDVKALLNNIVRWRLAVAVTDGVLELPSGWTLGDIEFEWIPTGIPWIDPLKEVSAQIAARDNGLTSTVAICKESGRDAYDIADEEAKYQEYRKGLGLATPGQQIVINNQIGGDSIQK